MDVYGVIMLCALVSCGVSSGQPQPSRSVNEKAAAAIASNNIEDTTSPPVNCSTAKGVSGVCVDRQYCDYSTYAIDLTLYASRRYMKFLKDWPKWDEFDQGINLLRKKNAYKSIKKTLELKYVDLKGYLKTQLELTKPLAKEAIDEMIEANVKRMEKVDTSEITLEVYCTRKQLNELILSRPIAGDIENTIFNLTEFKPTSITLNKLPIESILNWCGVQITIETKTLSYQRMTNHQLKHVLVNTKIGPRNFSNVLNPRLQIKEAKRTIEELEKEKLIKSLDKLLANETIQNNNQVSILKSLIELVKNDLHNVHKVKVPATYRQYSTIYPYYRKLRKEVKSNAPSTNYDLYIEETIAPMHVFVIGKVSNQKSASKGNQGNPSKYVAVECLDCRLKFSGDDMYTLMREHFDLYHSNEPDWNCTNCEKSFTMTELSRNKWHHYCS